MGEIVTSVKSMEPEFQHFKYTHSSMKSPHVLSTGQISALIHSVYSLHFLTVCLPNIFAMWADEINVFSSCLKQKMKLTTCSPRKKEGGWVYPAFLVHKAFKTHSDVWVYGKASKGFKQIFWCCGLKHWKGWSKLNRESTYPGAPLVIRIGNMDNRNMWTKLY